jgi:RHS repeat-associated protein
VGWEAFRKPRNKFVLACHVIFFVWWQIRFETNQWWHRCCRRFRENRLIQINYPGTGNNTQLNYDGLGSCVTIKETMSGTVTEQRDFVWCDDERCEVRNGLSGDALLRQFFGPGEVISGTSYHYSKDHLGSIREMTNSTGTIVWQQSFDPYGVLTTIVSTTAADFGFGGMYVHQRSGLSLTEYRPYSAGLGIWLSRDPIAATGETSAYSYAWNNPVRFIDPLGPG